MNELTEVLTGQLSRLAAEIAQTEEELRVLKIQFKSVARAIETIKEAIPNVHQD